MSVVFYVYYVCGVLDVLCLWCSRCTMSGVFYVYYVCGVLGVLCDPGVCHAHPVPVRDGAGRHCGSEHYTEGCTEADL